MAAGIRKGLRRLGRSQKALETEVRIWTKFNDLADQFMNAMNYSDYGKAKRCHMEARMMANLLELDDRERRLLDGRFPKEQAGKAYLECRKKNTPDKAVC